MGKAKHCTQAEIKQFTPQLLHLTEPACIKKLHSCLRQRFLVQLRKQPSQYRHTSLPQHVEGEVGEISRAVSTFAKMKWNSPVGKTGQATGSELY